jgi:hypothetical protein
MSGSNANPPRNFLQEYFSLIAEAELCSDTHSRDVRLLRAWGLLRYILSGPINCEHCEVPVQLAIPMTSERLTGETLQYDCLCTHCMFKELRVSKRIVMEVGGARVEYPHEDTPA